MTKTLTALTALAAAGFLLSAGTALAATPSACKGLEEGMCGKTDSCMWTKAIAAGDPTKAGGQSKVTRKAHCRLKRPTVSR